MFAVRRSIKKVQTQMLHSNNSTYSHLLELHKKNRENYGIEFDGYKTNHMTSSLVSLKKLGASDERLTEFFDFHAKELEKPRKIQSQKITKKNWKNFLSNKEFYRNYLEFFTNELKEKGLKKVLNFYFSYLYKGTIGSATHGIINLGYSLALEEEGRDLENIAEGLSYLVVSFLHVGEIKSENSTNKLSDIPNLLKELSNDQNLIGIFHSRNFDSMKFMDKIRYLINEKLEFFFKYDLNLSNETLEDSMDLMTNLTFEIYGKSEKLDFFLLHGCTGWFGMKNILKFIDDEKLIKKSIEVWWRVLLLTYVSRNSPMLSFNYKENSNLSWNEIKQLAINTNDAHIIKLVNVLYEYHLENNKDDEYLKNVAKRTLDVIKWF